MSRWIWRVCVFAWSAYTEWLLLWARTKFGNNFGHLFRSGEASRTCFHPRPARIGTAGNRKTNAGNLRARVVVIILIYWQKEVIIVNVGCLLLPLHCTVFSLLSDICSADVVHRTGGNQIHTLKILRRGKNNQSCNTENNNLHFRDP